MLQFQATKPALCNRCCTYTMLTCIPRQQRSRHPSNALPATCYTEGAGSSSGELHSTSKQRLKRGTVVLNVVAEPGLLG